MKDVTGYVQSEAAELEEDDEFVLDGLCYAVLAVDEESETLVGVRVDDEDEGMDTIDLDFSETVLVLG